MASFLDTHPMYAGPTAPKDGLGGGWIKLMWRVLVGGSLLLSLVMVLFAVWGLSDGLLSEHAHPDGMGGLGAIYATVLLIPCLTACFLLGLALTRGRLCRAGGAGMVTVACLLSGLGPAWLVWQDAAHSTPGVVAAGLPVLWFVATAVFSWGAIDPE